MLNQIFRPRDIPLAVTAGLPVVAAGALRRFPLGFAGGPPYSIQARRTHAPDFVFAIMVSFPGRSNGMKSVSVGQGVTGPS